MSIDNVYSPWVAPGSAAAMRVTFKRAGKYVIGINFESFEEGTFPLLTVTH